jgi:hypothetical protein
MKNYEIFQTSAGGFGYRIFINGQLCVVQEFMPGVEGFVQMTDSEAAECAEAELGIADT